ncbi:hypothetical protein BC941DRAFT_456946 [Chlamydoabsidia padenii]|nr:hypothetical protein BC941DRAFT_456946 [Chlamydoabsidia padenii]
MSNQHQRQQQARPRDHTINEVMSYMRSEFGKIHARLEEIDDRHKAQERGRQEVSSHIQSAGTLSSKHGGYILHPKWQRCLTADQRTALKNTLDDAAAAHGVYIGRSENLQIAGKLLAVKFDYTGKKKPVRNEDGESYPVPAPIYSSPVPPASAKKQKRQSKGAAQRQKVFLSQKNSE